MIKLVKKINNNYALAFDSKGEQIIVEGKGIGFVKMPCVLNDYSSITRTYYDFDDKYVGLLENIPGEIMSIANRVYDKACRTLRCRLNPNLPFVLADHITFTIERLKKQVVFTFPMYQELAYMYPQEKEIALYATELVKKETGITFPDMELAGLILNLINAEMDVRKISSSDHFRRWLDHFVEIIENVMTLEVSEESFNYSRFVSHLNYLYKRVKEKKKSSDSRNIEIYESLRKQYPSADRCVEMFAEYLQTNDHITIGEEEKLYLILHVNRLCDRELGL